MQCNIDQRGQKVRRIWGALCILAGAAAAITGWYQGVWWWYVGTGVLVAAGLFAFYEAKKKWCAIRAMGIKTPM